MCPRNSSEGPSRFSEERLQNSLRAFRVIKDQKHLVLDRQEVNTSRQDVVVTALLLMLGGVIVAGLVQTHRGSAALILGVSVPLILWFSVWFYRKSRQENNRFRGFEFDRHLDRILTDGKLAGAINQVDHVEAHTGYDCNGEWYSIAVVLKDGLPIEIDDQLEPSMGEKSALDHLARELAAYLHVDVVPVTESKPT